VSQSLSTYSHEQAIRSAHYDATGCLKVADGFLVGAVGRKIDVAYPSGTTETYTFKEGSTTLYVYTVTYTDSTKANLSSVERTA
jgi:hypothetical protein